MGCFKSHKSRSKTLTSEASFQSNQQNPEAKNLKQEVLLHIPGCKVTLVEEGEAIELANGDFTILRISDENVNLATIIKVGDDLQWPLTKDEPVVKLDTHDYLFSLPIKDGELLSYGVTFLQQYGNNLGLLDSFLKEHSCFSSNITLMRNKDIDWKEFAPRIDDYNNILSKAIAGGTGQIVKGIFKCSNAYTSQVQKGGQLILTRAAQEGTSTSSSSMSNKSNGSKKKSGLNKSLERMRKLSKMTENMSKAMLNGVGIVTGSVMTPVVQSQAGKAFLAIVPGEVLLASLDAVDKVLDAAETAERQALTATTGAASRMKAMHHRFGESAGEATEDVLATAGHCAGTAWNIFKIRKAINPASSVSSGIRNAAKNKNS
ncbi:Senescence/spartin-associated, C-terminal [Dillenia turbinata]|uniref:Senescence/spartin-associated, C-terminal n=1 Tax=Dillenia turbinata TaxID=194707 RepID=A0AAN8W513_9MAGN